MRFLLNGTVGSLETNPYSTEQAGQISVPNRSFY